MSCESDDAKALADIEKYGCHILHVMEDKSVPRFSYSIGIHKKANRPELIVTGLKQELAHWIINEYNSRVRDGEEIEAGQLYSGFLEGFDVIFKPVLQEHYKEYLGWGLWLYGDSEFPVYQLIWPSTKGTWPWDADASCGYRWMVPLLCEAEQLVECAEHGAQPATFVCQHILRGLEEDKPYGFWWADDPESTRPDAWCTACEEYLNADGGEWNDKTEAFAGVKLLCGSCYDRAKARNLHSR